MDDKYIVYMDNLALTERTAYGQCERVCRAMIGEFPELILCRGHYWDFAWGAREHWWIETAAGESGEIIDPTAVQFPSKGAGIYEPLDQDAPVPTGKCPNCGEYCYNGEHVHEECHSAFLASM